VQLTVHLSQSAREKAAKIEKDGPIG